MVKRWSALLFWARAGLWIAAFCSAASAFSAAQPGPASFAARPRPLKDRLIPDHFPPQPTIAPSWSIPVDALGFAPPGAIYLGSRNTLASLDFIGEDKLLFTFRIPGLLHRDGAGDERRIRAVVLSLPQGIVVAQADWTLHDRRRYLWMLNDGHFLLRDRNGLFVGDSSLNLKPFLQFPGPLLSLELDPSQQYLVTNSREPAKSPAAAGEGPSPATATASIASGETPDVSPPDTVVRILHRDSGKVMLVSRARAIVHLPINSDGYIEALRSQGWGWLINLSYFDGGSRQLATVDSRCVPTGHFVSDREILMTTCTPDGNDRIVALTVDGQGLWANQIPSIAIWPELTIAPDGLRIARETLGVSHTVNAYSPIDSDDIKGQWVTVYDAATGDMAFQSPVSPALDSGGNVAISPSSRRVAVLNAGTIQVFELPAPPSLPTGGDSAGHRERQ